MTMPFGGTAGALAMRQVVLQVMLQTVLQVMTEPS